MSSNLDPADWSDFRATAHALLDECLNQLQAAKDHPWQPVPDDIRKGFVLDHEAGPASLQSVVADMKASILPYGSGNTHPRFFGWVQGTGLASGLLAEMVAATMNSNCGGRDHGAVYVEREVVEWCRRIFGFPETASGILVSGTSQATVIALACARQKALGNASRKQGLAGAAQLTAYAATGVHNALVKALELLGLGSAALRTIPLNASGAMDESLLRKAIADDRAQGRVPFCIVATAGSVDLGNYDDLHAVADLCAAENMWMHVDGAFGAWARIAGPPYQQLVNGIERADSIAFDFHKWMFVQYDCGAVLVRDEAIHRATFAARPDYLAPQTAGIGGGDPWYCDYGIELSRGFRALKVWTALRLHGRQELGGAIVRCCQLATAMGDAIRQSSSLKLARPVTSNVCCFGVKSPSPGESSARNTEIATRLQVSGDAVFSTTKVGGETVLRAAIVNHRTTVEDVVAAIAAVERAAAAIPPAGA